MQVVPRIALGVGVESAGDWVKAANAQSSSTATGSITEFNLGSSSLTRRHWQPYGFPEFNLLVYFASLWHWHHDHTGTSESKCNFAVPECATVSRAPYRRTQADTDTGTNLQARESDKPEVGDNIFTSLMMAPVCTEVTRRSQHVQVEALSFSHPLAPSTVPEHQKHPSHHRLRLASASLRISECKP